MKPPIRFAVIGLGHIGKRHVEMISRHSDAVLVSLCDNDPGIQNGNYVHQVPVYAELDKLLMDGPEFDVLAIATPNGSHASIALKALAAGKHVIIEKPMALNSEDALNIINQAEKLNKKVFCVMQNRYSPPSQWIKSLMDDHILGGIYLVQINCYWNRDERYYTGKNWRGDLMQDGGTLFTQFSHFIDMMYWLFGDITNIQSKFNDFNHKNLSAFEDSGLIQFDFLSGGMGSISYSTSVWDSNMESSITVIGEKGSLKIGGQYMNEIEFCHIENYTMPVLEKSSPANDYGAYKGSAANHHFVYQNVLDVLKNDMKIDTNAKDGLKVVEIIERIYKGNPYLKNKN
jgi:predicted dehydrogenase